MFAYDASGNRISKLEKTKTTAGAYKTSDQWTTTYYARDAQGNVMATYSQAYNSATSKSEFNVTERMIYGSSRLGVLMTTKRLDIKDTVKVTPTYLYARTLGSRHYELSNHLGNVIAVVTDRREMVQQSGGVIYRPAVIGTTDYYAFGSSMPGRNYSSSNYRYGFNGKEDDKEIVSTGSGIQDYGARMYNSSLGKFLSVDMVANKFPWWSPYAFAGNTPIQALDLDGYEILNYKTPYRLRAMVGATALTNQWEIARSWSEDYLESQGMVSTATDISYGLASKDYNPTMPTVYPIYPGTGENQIYYNVTAGEQQELDFFGINTEPTTPSTSDASSNNTDGAAADRTIGQLYIPTNRNKTTNDRAGAIAGGIEWGSKKFFINSRTMRSVNAKIDMNNIIRAYAEATKIVEKFYNFSALTQTNNWTEEQVKQYKADIINFVVDGKLPNGQPVEYNKSIESNGQVIINTVKDADTQQKLLSDDN